MRGFKDGDKVKIRSWESMENEYGTDDDGDIPVPDYFVSKMKCLCRRTITVRVNRSGRLYCIEQGYTISPEMFVGDCILERREV